jgi:hypothetical protein
MKHNGPDTEQTAPGLGNASRQRTQRFSDIALGQVRPSLTAVVKSGGESRGDEGGQSADEALNGSGSLGIVANQL